MEAAPRPFGPGPADVLASDGTSHTDFPESRHPASTATSVPVDVRNVALVVLAVIACIGVLHWAASVIVPLLLGIVFSYALTPVVNRLASWRLPRPLAAAVLMVAILGGTGALAWTLSDDAMLLVQSLPEAAQKLRRGIERTRGQSSGGTIEKVQQAAAEIERATETNAAVPAPRGVTKVQIEKPKFEVSDYLWTGTLGLAAVVAQAVVVIFITFFLLASGDTFRRKMVRIAGPDFGTRRITLQALDEIDLQIQRYLMVQVITSLVVGIAIWLGFRWLDVEQAAVWGVVAFVLNFVPYFGSLLLSGASTLMGFVQFGNFEMALTVGGFAFFVNSIEGYLLTPWLTSKASRMNAVAVFVGVLAFGWIWGAWGLFLGVPIMMVIKAVCDRVEEFKPVGELLGQ